MRAENTSEIVEYFRRRTIGGRKVLHRNDPKRRSRGAFSPARARRQFGGESRSREVCRRKVEAETISASTADRVGFEGAYIDRHSPSGVERAGARPAAVAMPTVMSGGRRRFVYTRRPQFIARVLALFYLSYYYLRGPSR